MSDDPNEKKVRPEPPRDFVGIGIVLAVIGSAAALAVSLAGIVLSKEPDPKDIREAIAAYCAQPGDPCRGQEPGPPAELPDGLEQLAVLSDAAFNDQDEISGAACIGNWQIAWGKKKLDLPGTDTASHFRTYTFTFGSPFASTPIVTNGINASGSGHAFSVYQHWVNRTQYHVQVQNVLAVTPVSTPVTFNYIAIGMCGDTAT